MNNKREILLNMYKILIKQPHTRRSLFEPYLVNTIDDNGGEAIESIKEYSTDDLVELAEKYKELLAIHTTDQMRVVEELDIEVLVSIMNG